MMRRTIACGILLLLIAGCSGRKAAEQAVRDALKDPASAHFGDFTTVKGTGSSAQETFACLTVNARNSFGGYTGDQEAALVKQGGEWHVLTITEGTHQTCLDALRADEESFGGNIANM